MTAGDDDLLRNFLRTRKEMFDSEIGEDFDYSDFFTEGFVATCANLHPRAFGKFSFFDLNKSLSLSLSLSHVTKYINSRTSRSNTGTVRLGDATSSKPKIKYDAFVNKDDLNAILTCIRRFQTMLDAWNELDESPDAELLFHRGLERSHGKDTDEYWLEYVVFKFITSVTYFHHRKIARTATLKCTLQHSRIPTLEHQRSNTGTSDNFRV